MIYLSIIIPTLNEGKFIEATLTMLANQDYPIDRFELIVVDGGSVDNTREVVERFIEKHEGLNIRLLNNPGRLSSIARNIGIRASKGQLIGVIDAHVFVPNDQLFRSMERLKEENGALCLARPAPLDVPGLDSGKAYWIAVARKSWLGHSRDSYIYKDYEEFVDPVSSGFAYDRSVFEKVGYFDESFDAAEDVEFHFRLKKAGILAFTSPALLIYSYPRESFKGLFRQQARYGEGRARLIVKHRDAMTKETPIPAAILLYFVLSPLILFLPRHFQPLGETYFLGLMTYILILAMTGLRESRKRERTFPALYIALGIWTTHIGLGWGFLKTLMIYAVRRRREVPAQSYPSEQDVQTTVDH